jgi:hypothetical protein
VRSPGFILASNSLIFKNSLAVMHNQLSGVHGQYKASPRPQHELTVALESLHYDI